MQHPQLLPTPRSIIFITAHLQLLKSIYLHLQAHLAQELIHFTGYLKMNTIKIHNIETGEVIEREMNAAELAQLQADKVAEAARQEAKAAKAAERQAILDRLGLTAEEAQLLLGGTN